MRVTGRRSQIKTFLLTKTAPLSAGNALPLFDFARFAMNLTCLAFLINHFLVRKHSVSPFVFHVNLQVGFLQLSHFKLGFLIVKSDSTI